MASFISPAENRNPFDAIKSSIISDFDSLIQHLRLRQTELLSRLEELRLEWENRNEKHIKPIEKLNTMKNGIEALCIKDNDMALIHEATLKPILENLALLEEKVQFPRIVYKNHEIKSLSDNFNKLGEICDASDVPTIKSESEKNTILRIYRNRTEPITTIDEQGLVYGQLIDINAMCYNQSNKYLLLTSRLRNTVSCFTIEGDFVNAFGQQNLTEPYGLFSNLDYCFVIDKSLRVIKFNIYKRKLVNSRQFNTKIKAPVTTLNAIDGDIVNNIIYLLDSRNNNILLLSFDLEFIKTIDLKWSLDSDIQMGIFNNCIFILNISNSINCIHAISLEGEQLYSVVPRSYFSDVGVPQDFCIDSYGNFIISETSDCSLRVFSNGGYFVCSIGSKVGPPSKSVCFADGKIVCSYADGSIKMY
ncbi:hypothetical protein LOD99_12277 [Oopsacas minuta]|uniref:Uncharacterized protein n=1 Tax=Oopsacas minuta TaxID=111878 RepID=A0AAV7JEM8_9METZ|nr:hypothetical protein LOD99_12277 [Oopsacas minuta]